VGQPFKIGYGILAQSPEYTGPANVVIIAPPMTIYGQRVSADELIALEVVDRLASDPRLPGQVERAGLDAHVDGVRAVHNYLRAKLEL
jgi:hypothetical protein